MKSTIIIAEAGVNHNGVLDNAIKLVDVAVAAGVDYVKFQTFKADKLVSNKAKKADYQVENTADKVESQLDMLKKLELSKEDHEVIIAYCKSKDIKFFSTAFDLESLDYLASIGLDMVKIPSGEITNLPYLRKAAMLFSKVILSTGMATMKEIKAALDVFTYHGIELSSISILHCNTEYPTPMHDVNLTAMLHIGSTFHTTIGYSDHTLGIEVPIAAVALGAKIIEKHYTLDRSMPGPDHAASLEPFELKAMVSAIRNIESAISGSGQKEPSASEMKNISIARKSLHLAVDKKSGETLSAEDLMMLRPGDGISPMQMDEFLGRVLSQNLEAGHKLSLTDFKV
ncbi:N-acetylneuraminate synthase [Pedobacter sp. PACM 27299]|uniref:N-acetylneuraminate synthase n=1 Tax=Pedobacter sp. PACM 27299 TaxID=1727164 RepID=UPI0007065105|nr:N-acetylneuraminate synthase [Pedobacter sp. PACM 27299]ALL04387.1 N-acetylneuraminate synthase [Pedobacter sp. PACM 27299]